MSKSRTSSLFRKVSELNDDDHKASSKRRRFKSASAHLRAKATQSQLDVHNVLMEMRILLQKGVQEVTNKNFNDEVGHSENAAETLLSRLVETRRCMLDSVQDVEYDDNVKPKDDYERCRSMWKQVLNKRQEDLMISSGIALTNKKKFQVIDQGLWAQVEATLAHEQLRCHNENDETFFDDSKVYAHMLKSFITNNISVNKNMSSLAETTLSKGKKRKKKDIDTRASKGRKLRYTVNEKMMHFTFPVSRALPFLNADDWFKSLFGGTSRVQQRKTIK